MGNFGSDYRTDASGVVSPRQWPRGLSKQQRVELGATNPINWKDKAQRMAEIARRRDRRRKLDGREKIG